MRYTITTAARLAAGAVLGLGDEQARRRRHALKPIAGEKGWYTATADVHFKVGEQVELRNGELPKAMAELVEDEKAAAARKRAEQQAARAAQAKQEQALQTAYDKGVADGRAALQAELDAKK